MMMAKNKKKAAAAGTATLEAFEPDEGAPSDNYRVRLEMFEGPLDLLLFLIKKNEVDIYDIPVSKITKQYLEYLQLMRDLDIAVAGDFLVLASTLIYLKSKMLLPPDPTAEGDENLNEDPRMELVEQLLEYQKFKAAADMLHTRGQIEAACFTRAPLETDKSNPEVAASVFDLLRVFREILERAKSVVEMEIQRDEMTMSEKIRQIKALLAERHEINIREVFETAGSKHELILIFLVFLELVKELEITLVQSELFGDIIARKRSAAEKAEMLDADEGPATQASGAPQMTIEQTDEELTEVSSGDQPVIV